MRRRDFIAAIGGAAAALPLPARAQRQAVKRVGWLGGEAENIVIFEQELTKLGWTLGRNIHIDSRTTPDDIPTAAKEIVGAAPDLLVAIGTPLVAVLKQLTNTIPIVFINVADPVANNLVASYARPGANITGFTSVEFSFAGKWLNILRDLVPGIANAMALYEPANPNWEGYLRTLEVAGPVLGVNVHPTPAVDIADAITHIETFARDPGGGMIVLPGGLTVVNRRVIAALAARHRLPAVYPYKFFVTSGGLASYGSDTNDLARRAAQYADRILKGEKPADLPVQAPTKFEFVLNLRAAKALGLQIPPQVLALTDEVID